MMFLEEKQEGDMPTKKMRNSSLPYPEALMSF